MKKLQNLSADLDETLLIRFQREAQGLADTILNSESVQEDAEECCTLLLAYRAMLQQQKQDAERKQRTYQKEIESLTDNVNAFRKESTQLKQDVIRYQTELNALHIHVQDKSFRMLQLYMQNAQQEEELASLRGIPSPLNASNGMLTLQLQLKELESKKQIQLNQLHQLEQQQHILHKKIKKLKTDIVSGTLPPQKHAFAVLSMEIFEETLQQKTTEIEQVQAHISEFDELQEELSRKIESAFAQNGDETV